jgi:DNA-binding transcriptional MerR regulator
MWERRYGVPQPRRSADRRRRLYSDDDVERLRLIAQVVRAGYRIGDIARATPQELKALLAQNGGLVDPTPTSTGIAGASAVSPSRPPPADRGQPPSGSGAEQSRIERMLEMIARDDLRSLEVALRHSALALGPKEFAVSVAQPLAHCIGEGWARGELSIVQEHMACECLDTQVRSLLAQLQDVPAQRSVLLATVPDEEHVHGLNVVALYLAVSGAKPCLAGGPLPAREVADAARQLAVDAVGLRATGASDVTVMRRHVRRVAQLLPSSTPIWIGGAGADSLKLRARNIRYVRSWDELDHALAELARS